MTHWFLRYLSWPSAWWICLLRFPRRYFQLAHTCYLYTLARSICAKAWQNGAHPSSVVSAKALQEHDYFARVWRRRESLQLCWILRTEPGDKASCLYSNSPLCRIGRIWSLHWKTRDQSWLSTLQSWLLHLPFSIHLEDCGEAFELMKPLVDA